MSNLEEMYTMKAGKPHVENIVSLKHDQLHENGNILSCHIFLDKI